MPYAIARVGKIKSMGQASAANGHNLRTRETLNADPERTEQNRLLYGKADLPASLRERFEETGVTPRSDSVLCAEFVLTASPEFFEGKSREQVDQWANSQVEFLRGRYGDNVVQAVLHLDETTPHVHGMVTPILEREGKNRLSMKDYIGGKQNLRELQTAYGAAMAPHGLQRGQENSVAEHTTIKEFYGDMQTARKQPRPEVEVKPRFGTVPERSVFGVFSSDKITRAEALDYAKEAVGDYKKRSEKAIRPVLRENLTFRSDLNRVEDENRRLGRTLQRERAARQDERKQAHDNIIGLQNKATAFDMMKTYAPGHFNAAMSEVSAKRRAEQEAKQRAERERKEREQAEATARERARLEDRRRLEQTIQRQQQNQQQPPKPSGPRFGPGR